MLGVAPFAALAEGEVLARDVVAAPPREARRARPRVPAR